MVDRLYILFIIIFVPLEVYANCKIAYTNRSPFYVVDVNKNSQDTFYLSNNPSYVSASYNKQGRSKLLTESVYDDQFHRNGRVVKRNTIVRAKNKIQSNSEVFVEVEILSEKNTNLNKILTNPLNKGETGYLSSKSLRSIKDSELMILNKDTFFISNTGNKFKTDAGSYLEPISSNGIYKIRQCRIDGKVQYFYLYNLKSLDGESKEQVEIHQSSLSCLDLSIAEKKDYSNLKRFLSSMENLYGKSYSFDELEYNEFGLVNLPQIITNPNTREIVSISYNEKFVHYKGGDPLGSDTWGQPDTICEFMTIANDWFDYCHTTLGYSKNRCKIQVGDISWISPGKMDNGKDPLWHRHHNDGTCIDIRPFRADDKLIGTTIDFDVKGYDPKINEKFLKFIMAKKASPIYFGDKSLSKKLGKINRNCDLHNPKNDLDQGVLNCKGHMNHIHFCLKPERVRGCN